eukprot:TRINITY_DN1084_c4_g1_i2.p1 TRINITY_DN1084_c4_g1~~TRINITY_DN1084_c4_g1_i2.p1  ORF type:complete len:793 (+),score=173.84 TRINITY_DN1084_c4_g1_i2:66-2444(+)
MLTYFILIHLVLNVNSQQQWNTSVTTGYWHDSTNWISGIVPAPGESVNITFGTCSNCTIIVNQSIVVDDLNVKVNQGSKLNFQLNANMTFNTSTFTHAILNLGEGNIFSQNKFIEFIDGVVNIRNVSEVQAHIFAHESLLFLYSNMSGYSIYLYNSSLSSDSNNNHLILKYQLYTDMLSAVVRISLTIPVSESFLLSISSRIESLIVNNYGEFNDTTQYNNIIIVPPFEFNNYGTVYNPQMRSILFKNFGNVTGVLTTFDLSTVKLFGPVHSDSIRITGGDIHIFAPLLLPKLLLSDAILDIQNDVEINVFEANTTSIQSSAKGFKLQVLNSLAYIDLDMSNDVIFILRENGKCTKNQNLMLSNNAVFVNDGYFSISNNSNSSSSSSTSISITTNSVFVNIGTIDHISNPYFVVNGTETGTFINLGTMNLEYMITMYSNFMHCDPGNIKLKVTSNTSYPNITFVSLAQEVTISSNIDFMYPDVTTRNSLLMSRSPVLVNVTMLYSTQSPLLPYYYYLTPNVPQNETLYLCWDYSDNITIETDQDYVSYNCRGLTNLSLKLCPTVSDYLYGAVIQTLVPTTLEVPTVAPPPSEPPLSAPTDVPTIDPSEPPPSAPSDAPSSTPSSPPTSPPSLAPTPIPVMTPPPPASNLELLRLTVTFSSTNSSNDITSTIDTIITQLSGILQVVKEDITYTIISTATTTTTSSIDSKYMYSVTFIISNRVSSTTTSVLSGGDDIVARAVNNFKSIDQLFQRSLGDHTISITRNGSIISDSSVVLAMVTRWIAVLLVLITIN